MATFTITAQATVTLDGTELTQSATYMADARSILEGTRDLTNAFAIISGAGFAFALIENVGNDAIIVRQLTVGGDYIRIGIPVGGHAFIPCRTGTAAAGMLTSNSLAVRSVTSAGSRVRYAIGGNWTNE